MGLPGLGQGKTAPLGNLYWIQARVEDPGPQEKERRLADREFITAMEYVQSAEFFPGVAGGLDR
ncbi:hypothetical protein Q3V23_01340 [Streptomyces sp. VNUA116]|uniref:hypothetical protein n=1 Tax=Streptomyces sp. VNUA116 TaxID=3062449 RepID=UPI002676AF83|nr:hypothetical protein [Streptomyces sp. VNUA116]WKU42818.1 hypothetical protein Q3V23_01340 [Streptomyces sp. VNUA116]